MRRMLVAVVLVSSLAHLAQAGRYYDARTGRFLQTDPKMHKLPGWSPYNYALNNPLKYIDPDGKEVRIYSRWSGPGHRHLFIIVKNEKTGVFTSRALMPAGGPLEGIYTALPFVKGGSTPEIRKDLDSELGAVKRQEAGEKDVDAHREMVVQPPSGMSEAEYDDAVLKAADSYDVEGRPYDADDGPNSNTYVNDVIESTGVTLPQFDKATQQKWSDEQKKKEEEKKKQEEKQKKNQQNQQ
jgi:uncharacterized protein RhaS with RHS repeats